MLCMPSFADGGKEGHRMNQSISEIIQEIKSLNDITLKGEIVIFGSDYMADFPFYELINHYQIENAVYNRSIAGLTLADAAQALQDCVLAIKPAKVFLAFGEHDAENPDAFTRYKGILHYLRTELPAAKLHVIGLPGEHLQLLNEQLTSYCRENDLPFIRFAKAATLQNGLYKAQFKQLSCFFRNAPMNLSDVFAMAQ